eukprot:15435421-Alexandrium_andersonii.AAC.1
MGCVEKSPSHFVLDCAWPAVDAERAEPEASINAAAGRLRMFVLCFRLRFADPAGFRWSRMSTGPKSLSATASSKGGFGHSSHKLPDDTVTTSDVHSDSG